MRSRSQRSLRAADASSPIASRVELRAMRAPTPFAAIEHGPYPTSTRSDFAGHSAHRATRATIVRQRSRIERMRNAAMLRTRARPARSCARIARDVAALSHVDRGRCSCSLVPNASGCRACSFRSLRRRAHSCQRRDNFALDRAERPRRRARSCRMRRVAVLASVDSANERRGRSRRSLSPASIAHRTIVFERRASIAPIAHDVAALARPRAAESSGSVVSIGETRVRRIFDEVAPRSSRRLRALESSSPRKFAIHRRKALARR